MEVINMYEVDEYTVSLLHFENGIKDECENAWSIQNNGVSISQAQVEDGSYSAYFNATGGIYTAPSNKFTFGAGDLTIDFRLYYIDGNYEPNYGNVAVVLDSRSGLEQYPLEIGIFSDYKICFTICGKTIYSAPGVITPNSWVHVACVRNNGIGYIFVNGKSVASGNLDNNITQLFPSFPLYLGGDGNLRSDFGAVKCYLDEFRISNIARWTSDFDPEDTLGHGLLRITMNDSSEREYRLTTTEIENFIKWYDRTVGTGNTCYAFDDIVDLSKEYLSFEKIISFKVIPLQD
jgi:hypothetical protein